MASGDNRHPILAALTLCVGIMIFSFQDWIIKAVSGDYPVHQAIVIRSVVAMPIILVIIAFHGGLGTLRSRSAPWLCLRGLVLVVAYTAYYLAFPAMPLATIIALWFTTPLFVTALAGPMLGEKVGLKRWAATVFGFIGVLIVVRPGTESFSLAYLLPILSSFTYAISALMARRMGTTDTAPVMSAYQNVMYLLAALVMAAVFRGDAFASDDPSLAFLTRDWSMPTLLDFSLLAACGVIAAVATVLLAQAYRMAEANFVTSFEYSAMIWASLGGYWFWGEVPDWPTWIGSAFIIGAGLFMLFGARPTPNPPVDVKLVD